MPQRLVKGFKTFRESSYEGDQALMPRLVAEGQNPDLFIISCIDSRSNPGTVFNAAPGTFFSHKAMGAIVRPYKQGTALSAALQFALNYNHISHIVILGHTGCGAIKALIEDIDDEEISGFVNVAQEGIENARHCCATNNDSKDLSRHAEEQIVLLSLKNLQTYPSVKSALDENRVKILGWLFDMENGTLHEYNPDTGLFEQLP